MTDDGRSIERRKREHLDLVLERSEVLRPDVSSGFERYRFVHNALPEIDFEAIDTSTALLGKRLRAPLYITAMTGGAPGTGEINRRLAAAAQRFGIAMGVGSQRAALADPALVASYRVRDAAPDVLLFANLGAVQLVRGLGVEDCRRAVEMIEADALALHLNPVQEAIQEGGDTTFGGVLSAIERVCRALDVPVIVKEVGFGLSPAVARRLADAGVSAVDVAGAGGTPWSKIEGLRARDPVRQRAGQTFGSWGIPTAECLRALRDEPPGVPVLASGGIRDGVDVAKAIALGAAAAGVGAGALAAAAASEEDAARYIESVVFELRVAMFGIGARTIDELAATDALVSAGP
jgi:isopentenyl-diphosphate delta-isomerase